MNIEQLGLLGVFLAGAVPWFEAIAVIPAGIVLGLDPILTVTAAAVGNAITIFVFAFAGARIRSWIITRREAKGKPGDSPKYQKALAAFDRYGIWGMAALGPILIGTQFAAAASVAAGVKPMKVSLLVTVSMVLWASGIAWGMTTLGLTIP
jgi:hypothetical protein